MPIFGGCVVRLSDRVLLHQSNVGPTSTAVDPLIWADVVSRCTAPAFRTSAFLDSRSGQQQRVGYHIVSDEELAFVVLTDESAPRRTAHLVLDDMSRLFRKMFVEPSAKLTASACDVFRGPLIQLLERQHDGSDEKVKAVKRTVEEVKGLALDNVERVLARGQQIDEIVSATDELQASAQGFQRNSRNLRNQMWWNNAKTKFIIGGGVALFLLVVYFIFCGGISCSSSSNTSST